jgi:hypothetical protein
MAEKPSPQEYFNEMIALYPDRLNVGPVWYTAAALLSGDTSRSSVRDEVAHWFLDDYLPTWVGVAAGTIPRGPEFILDYWAVPLHWSDDQGARWVPYEAAVVELLQQLQTRLRGDDYAYTSLPDRKVKVYHDNGAAIEVIWSRRRSDGTEIERLAAHFEVARGPAGWRVIGIQATPTTKESLKDAWPQGSKK